MSRSSSAPAASQKNAHLDGVPILTGERIDGLLLETLLALGEALVLSDGHCGLLYRSVREEEKTR